MARSLFHPALALAALACAPPPPPSASLAAVALDPHTFARPLEVAVEHLALDLTVDFATRIVSGTARLDLDRRTDADELVLDTRDLTIVAVTGGDGRPAAFRLGSVEPHLGQPLAISLAPGTKSVTVTYATSPAAGALQWLEPAQTAGPHPFLFTQSQAALARTWIPLQDSPSVRFTYEARVRVPPGLVAVMSAENSQVESPDGVYTFRMDQPVPSYLMALAVGDLEFRSLGIRSGVYAEPAVVEKAAWEFADTEKLIEAAETLYGPYRWGRYDLLVLPPSFPFGGMENPRLTFATPTILAGDRSLVALVAHELAHSWSGNLVTNATWNDFWLNEGFTTYAERRIMEAVFGADYADMLAVIGRGDLETSLADLPPEDTRLRLELAGRDPDESGTDIPYEKGALFLTHLERAAGRERFDSFLNRYFTEHAFQSMTTDGFLAFLDSELLKPAGLTRQGLGVAAWIDGPGLPPDAPRVTSKAFDRVEAQLDRWRSGALAADLETQAWTTHEWVHFLRGLPVDAPDARLSELDLAFGLSERGNKEVLFAWLMGAVRAGYEPAQPAVERFLTSLGRRKFLMPLYGELAKTESGKARAIEIYRKARPTYHPVAVQSVDELLGWPR
jgi:aminopeptidase N